MVVLPGRIIPSRSAASIIATPMRSFTLAAGFCDSSLATTRAATPLVTVLSATSGVLPISLVTSLAIFIVDPSWVACRPRRGKIARPRPAPMVSLCRKPVLARPY